MGIGIGLVVGGKVERVRAVVVGETLLGEKVERVRVVRLVRAAVLGGKLLTIP
jgi:hypothetical protein